MFVLNITAVIFKSLVQRYLKLEHLVQSSTIELEDILDDKAIIMEEAEHIK